MELELRHLAGYLPYRLKALDDDEVEWELFCLTTNGIVELIHEFNAGSYEKIIDEIKPILRPLSDLIKEIEVNGEKFVPIEKLHLNRLQVEEFLKEDLWIGQWWDYEKIQKLYEWHFDIHGLIEAGLAIDINTLNN